MTSSVGPTGGSPNAAGSLTGNQSLSLSAQDFMNLFLTQLKNQNPTSPMDSSTMLQQMANLSSMSASTDMEQKMDSLAQTFQTTMGNSQVLAATQLIGKQVDVTYPGSMLTQNPDNSLTLNGAAELNSAASDVKVTITDPNTKAVVKTIDLGPCTNPNGGLMDFNWNGISDVDGKAVAPGFYKVSATATVNGQTSAIYTAGTFNVKSVALGQNGVVVNLDGIGGQDMGSIIKIL